MASISPTQTIAWSYDGGGVMLGFSLTITGVTNSYFYLRNAQGDIVGISNTTGELVARYEYDAWGNPVDKPDDPLYNSDIAQLNPIRYRRYYYDTETGFYYCQSRYYSPELCRFISADVIMDTGQGVLGTNMYAYCLNNPVMLYDPEGEIAVTTVIIIVGAVGFGTLGGFGGNALADHVGAEGWDKAAYIAGGAVIGGVGGGLIGKFVAPAIIPLLPTAANAVPKAAEKAANAAPQISASTRDILIQTVQNPKLYNAVEQLYRPGAIIGDGGTADMLLHEFATGQPLTHLQKATEWITALERIISTQTLSASDLSIAQAMLLTLQNAVKLVTK